MPLSPQFKPHRDGPRRGATARTVVAAVLVSLLLDCGRQGEWRARGVAPASPKPWGLAVGGPGVETVTGLALDGSGNVVIGGSFDQPLVFGVETHATAGGADAFVAKLSPGGKPLWFRSAGGAGAESLTALVVDGDGAVYGAGTFVEPIDAFGVRLTAVGGSDIFVFKLDPAGNLAWARSFGGPGLDDNARLAVDNSGHVVVTGAFSGQFSFGDNVLTGGGKTDIFVARLRSDTGAPLLGVGLGGADSAETGALALAPGGQVVLAGTFSGRASLPGPLSNAGEADIFISRLGTFRP